VGVGGSHIHLEKEGKKQPLGGSSKKKSNLKLSRNKDHHGKAEKPPRKLRKAKQIQTNQGLLKGTAMSEPPNRGEKLE